MAQFCTQCGNEIKPGSKFCNKCGQPVGEHNTSDININKEEVAKKREFTDNDELTKKFQSFKDSKKIIAIVAAIVVIFSLSLMAKSIFADPNGSIQDVMDTYGKYCSSVYNAKPSEYIDNINLKLVRGDMASADFLHLVINRTKTTLPELIGMTKLSGEIAYASVNENFIKESKNGKALCGVIFYDKKTGIIYYEHIMLLTKLPSGKYLLNRVDIYSGVKEKSKYENSRFGENLSDKINYRHIDRFVIRAL